MTVNGSTDTFLVTRGSESFYVKGEDINAKVLDDDLFLVNRSGSSYKMTGADMKTALIPPDVPPLVTTLTLTEDTPGGDRFTNQNFTAQLTLADEGKPQSQKTFNASVKGQFQSLAQSNNITDVDTLETVWIEGGAILISGNKPNVIRVLENGTYQGHSVMHSDNKLYHTNSFDYTDTSTSIWTMVQANSQYLGNGGLSIFESGWGLSLNQDNSGVNGVLHETNDAGTTWTVIGTGNNFKKMWMYTNTENEKIFTFPSGRSASNNPGRDYTGGDIYSKGQPKERWNYTNTPYINPTDIDYSSKYGRYMFASKASTEAGSDGLHWSDNGITWTQVPRKNNVLPSTNAKGLLYNRADDFWITKLFFSPAKPEYNDTLWVSNPGEKGPNFTWTMLTNGIDFNMPPDVYREFGRIPKTIKYYESEDMYAIKTTYNLYTSTDGLNWFIKADTDDIKADVDPGYGLLRDHIPHNNGILLLYDHPSKGTLWTDSLLPKRTELTFEDNSGLDEFEKNDSVNQTSSGASATVLNVDEAAATMKVVPTNQPWVIGEPLTGELQTRKESEKYLAFDSSGNVTDLLDNPQDPAYTTAEDNPSLTLKFPSTFPSGQAPDVELGDGTTLTVTGSATNSEGTSGPKSADVTPTTVFNSPAYLMTEEEFNEQKLKLETYNNRKNVVCGEEASANRDDLIGRLYNDGYTEEEVSAYIE